MSERELLKAIEIARKQAEWSLRTTSYLNPENILMTKIRNQYSLLNNSSASRKKNVSFFVLDNLKLEKVYEKPKTRNYNNMLIGSSLVLAGQPFIKKRFVTKGAAVGTSLASKYLSKALPQTMPTRILGTKVFGRAIGRVVPYVGWAMLIIDSIELIIEEIDDANENQKTQGFGGFGGGQSSGGGAGGSW